MGTENEIGKGQRFLVEPVPLKVFGGRLVATGEPVVADGNEVAVESNTLTAEAKPVRVQTRPLVAGKAIPWISLGHQLRDDSTGVNSTIKDSKAGLL